MHLYAQLLIASNYNAIASLHTLQITRTRQVLSIFTSLILATAFNAVVIPVSNVSRAHIKSCFHSRTSKSTQLTLNCHLFSIIFHCRLKRLPQLLFQLTLDPCYRASGRIHRKHRFNRYSSTVLRLLLTYSLSREPVYRVVAWQWMNVCSGFQASCCNMVYRSSYIRTRTLSVYLPRKWRQ
jgi:hypothetical protein